MATLDKEFEVDQQFLEDNDSLYVLPLKFVPFETGALRRCRLIKTYSLNTAVEVYSGGENGRGYFELEDVLEGRANSAFGWPDSGHHPDIDILNVLGSLNSYDVFNLRVKFGKFEIEYEGNDYLCLSSDMERELTVYMRQFTRPLIQTVFGDTGKEAATVSDIVDLLRNPDSREAMGNLKRLAERLEVDVDEIPAFLVEFSDVYLAVSFYKHYADRISVMNAKLFAELQVVRKNIGWKADPEQNRICDESKSRIHGLLMEVFRRLDVYERETKDFWFDLNAERFRNMQVLLNDSQDVIGGILCGLGVKLARWRERFPTDDHGGVNTRIEAIQNELLPGLSGLALLATTGQRRIEPNEPVDQERMKA